MNDEPGSTHTHYTSPFDAIQHIDEKLSEYWSARELYKILGYTEWRNFNNIVIKRAMKACEENGRVVADHFVRSYKMVELGSGSKRKGLQEGDHILDWMNSDEPYRKRFPRESCQAEVGTRADSGQREREPGTLSGWENCAQRHSSSRRSYARGYNHARQEYSATAK